MKIAFIATGTPRFDDFPDPSAGSSSQIWALAVEYATRGHDVTIYRGTFDSPETWESDHDITIVDVPTPSIDAKLNGMFTKLLFSYRVRSRLRDTVPDVVFMRERYTAFFAAHSDLDTVYTVDSPDSFPFFRSFSTSKHPGNYLLYPYKNIIERSVLRSTGGITTISRYMREYLDEKGYDNTHFTGVCVDPTDFSDKISTANDQIILFAGRFVELKRPEWAVDAFADCAPDGFELHFAGEGPLKSTVQDKVTQHGLEAEVTFHGWMDRTELLTLMSRTSILIHPSLFEMGGNVVLEAMASGCPVVAGDAMGPRTLVEHGETGFLFERDDKSGMTKYLRSLIDDKTLRSKMGQSARSRALNEFDIESVADRFLGAYRSLPEV